MSLLEDVDPAISPPPSLSSGPSDDHQFAFEPLGFDFGVHELFPDAEFCNADIVFSDGMINS